ncbi:B12-binding domain-containing radical SAM protein [Brenneria rubrifaciens]|uniref:Radical SAM protein n=2 Tax=Brenneria rubrifaciens TaxID=55213 RepID=A0A4P8QPN7_9GAMM|nr:B12-binding domain-containing radical SAM protein [Brenneria rubrifaciens]QCR07419.1 radical SAM protein [Brenneria rubrifaciens]
MFDISMLEKSGTFSVSEGPPRLALVHHGFRTTQLGAADKRQDKFAARYASLGLLNLARSAQVDAEHGLIPFKPYIKYFDEDNYSGDAELATAISEWLRPACARFVLISLYSLAFERTRAMVSLMDPEEFCIMVGGAHPTVAPEIDFAHLVVRGEGGGALRHTLSTFLKPDFGEGEEARGICFVRDGKVTMGATVFDKSLASIPSPAFAYELIQDDTTLAGESRERWWKAVGESQQIYICTQSCRARCTFCSTYLIHGKLVSRPVELIEGDIRYLLQFGNDSIQFHDDDLLQHESLDELLEMLSNYNILWTCNARSEVMNANLAARMYRAGCRKVFLGLESMDQRSLDYYNKATTVEMNINAVTVLDAAGIGVVCGYIIGAPHDTITSILDDLDRVLKLPIFFLATAILTPDIGTTEYKRALRRIPLLQELGDGGTKMNIRPRPDLFGASAPYGLPTVAEAVTKDQLNELYAMVNCEFILRPELLERVHRYVYPTRLNEALSWCSLQRQRVRELASGATIPEVRQRAKRLSQFIENRGLLSEYEMRDSA